MAAIPSLYTLTQAVLLQAVVAAPPGSQPAVQDALVAASTSGQLAMALRNQGKGPVGLRMVLVGLNVPTGAR